MIWSDSKQFWNWMNFSKKTAPGAVFFRGVSKFEKISFFLKKIEKFQNFISFVFDEFLFPDINFFPVKLRRHAFQWFQACVTWISRSSHLKFQSALEKWENPFLSTDSKIVTFKLQMCRNSILTSEIELTTHFWSRTTLVHVYHSYSDLCGKKTKNTHRALGCKLDCQIRFSVWS